MGVLARAANNIFCLDPNRIVLRSAESFMQKKVTKAYKGFMHSICLSYLQPTVLCLRQLIHKSKLVVL